MAYISFKPKDYFNTVLYTGNGSDAHGITGVGFQPDWVWTKIRSGADNHGLYDVVRGVNKNLQTNSKIGRNDPCPCGSGKKYKKCFGTSDCDL